MGNIRTALLNWLLAAGAGGRMLLRVEDTDSERNQPDGEAAIVEDLAWLGLTWAGQDGAQPYRQSEQDEVYARYFARLREAGQAYPCFCSAEKLAADKQAQTAAHQPPRYAGHCRGLSEDEQQRRLNAGEAAAWRFRMPSNESLGFDDLIHGTLDFNSDSLDDFIIRRSDERNGGFVFSFVNAIDDAEQGITHVLRGDDHLSNTPRQIALLRALNLPIPEYAHMALMVGASGRPLSKREGLLPIRQWRAQGYLPAAVINYLAQVGNPHLLAAAESDSGDSLADLPTLAWHFDVGKISTSSARFDPQQLQHYQKAALAALSDEEFVQWAQLDSTQANTAVFATAIRDNVLFRSDVAEWQAVVENDSVSHTEAAKAALAAAPPQLFAEAAAACEQGDWKTFTTAVASATNIKGKPLFLPLRAALTGRTDGPAMNLLYPLISKARRRARFAARI